MQFFDWLKGVFNKMIGKEAIQEVLKMTPIVSNKMKNAIELWEKMYKNESPWLNNNIHSLGIASLVASEKARMATLEMEVKVTGEGQRPDFIRDTYKILQEELRKQLEYGIALGGFVIKPYVVMGPNDKYKIKFNFTSANNFYPLSFSSDGSLISAAFVDRVIKGDMVYSKVEVHTLADNSVTVNNYAFESKNTGISNDNIKQAILGSRVVLSSIEEWSNLQEEVTIANTDMLLFGYFRNPDANTVDLGSPLGTSGFSRAVGLIEEADKQYSNLLWEFKGGQLAVDVDRTALNPLRDANGKENLVLPELQDRLFRRNLDLGEDDMYNIFSPNLRDTSIINGLNNILMHIEDVCSLSRGTLSEVTTAEARTATELKILKQRAFASNADVQKELQNTLEQVFKVIDVYCELYDIVPEGKYEVAYNWDDSILIDKDSERQIDLIDIEKGLMSKVEYRMKWKGETKNQAEDALKEIKDEAEPVVAPVVEPSLEDDVKNPKQEEQDKIVRANESLETSKIDK